MGRPPHAATSAPGRRLRWALRFCRSHVADDVCADQRNERSARLFARSSGRGFHRGRRSRRWAINRAVVANWAQVLTCEAGSPSRQCWPGPAHRNRSAWAQCRKAVRPPRTQGIARRGHCRENKARARIWRGWCAFAAIRCGIFLSATLTGIRSRGRVRIPDQRFSSDSDNC